MKKRAMKKWIPVATPWCEDCSLLKVYSDCLGNKYSLCRYTGKVWLHSSPNKVSDDDSKRCNVHESKEAYTKARIKNIKIMSELYKYEYNKITNNKKNKG